MLEIARPCGRVFLCRALIYHQVIYLPKQKKKHDSNAMARGFSSPDDKVYRR